MYFFKKKMTNEKDTKHQKAVLDKRKILAKKSIQNRPSLYTSNYDFISADDNRKIELLGNRLEGIESPAPTFTDF